MIVCVGGCVSMCHGVRCECGGSMWCGGVVVVCGVVVWWSDGSSIW